MAIATGRCFCNEVQYAGHRPLRNSPASVIARVANTRQAPQSSLGQATKKESFQLVQGKNAPLNHRRALRADFCPDCGSPISYENEKTY